MSLPGRERLRNDGVTFTNHYCPAVMCTSSRAVILTGLQTPDNGMFENVDMPYVNSMNPDIPTVGDMLRKAGYYTRLQGQVASEQCLRDREQPDHLFTKEMEANGFSDYVMGRRCSDPHAGWLPLRQHDRRQRRVVASRSGPDAGRREQRRGHCSSAWSTPHDIMYFNTDAPGQNVQDNGRLLMEAAGRRRTSSTPRPGTPRLPKNLTQPMNEPGRPAAHGEYLKPGGTRWHHPPE